MSSVIKLQLGGIGHTTQIITINQDASIEELLEKITEWNGISLQEQRVIFAGKQLQTHKLRMKQTLRDYSIQDRSLLQVVVRVKGGMKILNTDSTEIDITYDPDIITFDDDKYNPRAKMSCGHAIGPDSLTSYCRHELTKEKYEFHCPECKSIWNYNEVRRCAMLTEEETKEFETKINKNLFLNTGVSECPKCSTKCEKSRDTRGMKVLCTHCKNQGQEFYFCWSCMREWKEYGERICGNNDCDGMDRKTRILQSAEKVEIVGIRNCPAIRACPSCHTLIMHADGCKQMDCPCGQKFCFVCLKVAINGAHQCSSFGSCTIAPIQDLSNEVHNRNINMRTFASILKNTNNYQNPGEALRPDSACIIL